jgi:hypothetical protein
MFTFSVLLFKIIMRCSFNFAIKNKVYYWMSMTLSLEECGQWIIIWTEQSGSHLASIIVDLFNEISPPGKRNRDYYLLLSRTFSIMNVTCGWSSHWHQPSAKLLLLECTSNQRLAIEIGRGLTIPIFIEIKKIMQFFSYYTIVENEAYFLLECPRERGRVASS